MNKTITQKIAEIEKGCGKIVIDEEDDFICGDKRIIAGNGRLCKYCQAKLSATKSTAKELIDDEIIYLQAMRVNFIESAEHSDYFKEYVDERLNLLQKQRSELK